MYLFLVCGGSNSRSRLDLMLLKVLVSCLCCFHVKRMFDTQVCLRVCSHTQTMAKVITSMLKFPPDQAQKVLDKEDSKVIVRHSEESVTKFLLTKEFEY